MNGVNELFQNIRFLKFYGWGRFVRILKFRTNKKNFSRKPLGKWCKKQTRHRTKVASQGKYSWNTDLVYLVHNSHYVANTVNTNMSFPRIWVPSAMALFTFMCYTVLSGGTLTVSKTFTALSLFSMLQGPMMELPEQLFSFLHGMLTTVKRSCASFLTSHGYPSI